MFGCCIHAYTCEIRLPIVQTAGLETLANQKSSNANQEHATRASEKIYDKKLNRKQVNRLAPSHELHTPLRHPQNQQPIRIPPHRSCDLRLRPIFWANTRRTQHSRKGNLSGPASQHCKSLPGIRTQIAQGAHTRMQARWEHSKNLPGIRHQIAQGAHTRMQARWEQSRPTARTAVVAAGGCYAP